METSNALSNLAAALAAFQSGMTHVPHSSSVNAGKYRYTYANLSTITAHIREPLAHQGLSVSQHIDDGGLTTILLHTSGEYLMSRATFDGLPFENEKDLGGIISYMRRYALAAVLGLVTDDDNEAHRPAATERKQRQAPKKSYSVAQPQRPALDPDAWRAK